MADAPLTTSRRSLLSGCGLALAVAGALTAFINAVLTPLLPMRAPFAQVAASQLFLARQGLSALAAVLLLFGAIGVHLRQGPRSGRFGSLAFVTVLVGSGFLLATEWAEVFVVHTLGVRVPEALKALEGGSHGPTLYDIGAMIAFSVFALGWIAFSISILRARVLPRVGAGLVIAGLILTPLLAAPLTPAWGAAVGDAVLGAGWVLLGRAVARSRPD